MKNWKMSGLVAVASGAVFLFAGAAGRSAVWANPEGEARVEAQQPARVAVSDRQATADADADNGPGCAESVLNP